jgi:hypothetical protein
MTSSTEATVLRISAWLVKGFFSYAFVGLRIAAAVDERQRNTVFGGSGELVSDLEIILFHESRECQQMNVTSVR